MNEFKHISSVTEIMEMPLSVILMLFDGAYTENKCSPTSKHIAVVLSTLYRKELSDEHYLKVYEVLVTNNDDYELKSLFKTNLDKRIDEVRIRQNEFQENYAYNKELNTYLK
jgi:hypothetical protein